MASTPNLVTHIVEQMSNAGAVSAKKMFGEYGIFCDGKMVALICNDLLFIKPTETGEHFIGIPTMQPPYPGAKPYFLIPPEQWEDHTWITELIQITFAELPFPKKKNNKK